MKLVAAHLVASHFINPTITQALVPLNPILGETLQRELETGEKFHAEQISHHPPITAYSMYGPDESFQLHGYHTLKAWFNGS